jgi:hypothetical protein
VNGPLVFLDFDGVLNSWESERCKRSCAWEDRLDWKAIERLNRLVAVSGAGVVVSSAWRLGQTVEQMANLLEANGFTGRVVGVTPSLVDKSVESADGIYLAKERGEEISAWREATRHEGPFVVLDDGSDMRGVEAHFVQTDHEIGLLDEHVNRALELLGVTP